MESTLSLIALRRLNIWVNGRSDKTNRWDFKTIVSLDAARLGYQLSPSALNWIEPEDYADRMEILRERKGANVQYVPLFSNFPAELPNDNIYLIRRILGAFGLKTFNDSSFGADPITQRQSLELWTAAVEAQKQKAGDSRSEMITLSVLRPQEARERLVEWVELFVYGKTPVAEYLWDDLLEAINGLNLKVNCDRIVIKETLVRIAATQWLSSNELFLRTPTDILRLFAFLQKQDVSLAEPVVLKGLKLNRPQRRAIATMLQKCENTGILREEIQKYRGLWLSIARSLHLGDYKKLYPGAVSAFDALYQDKIVSSDSVLVNSGFQEKLDILEQERPGLFVRWISRLVKEGGSESVIESMLFIRDQLIEVPMPILLSAYTALIYNGERVVINKKGGVFVIPARASGKLEEVAVVLKSIISERLTNPELLGKKVYINQSVLKMVVPLAARKQSEGLLDCARGSRIPIPEDVDVLRFFVYWKDAEQRTDLDLSLVRLTSDFTVAERVSFSSYGDGSNFAHSGDIQSGALGATEFIDIRLDKLPKLGVAMPVIFRFNGDSFNKLEQCHAGWMYRTNDQPSGDLKKQAQAFDPKTVANKVTVNQGGKLWMPMVIDLANREIVYIDLYRKGYEVIEQNKDLLILCRLMCKFDLSRPTFGLLTQLFIQANDVILVSSKEDSDIEFSSEKLMKLVD